MSSKSNNMKKVKSIFDTEIHYLYYLNNRLVTTFVSYEDVCNYCAENNLDLVKSTGI